MLLCIDSAALLHNSLRTLDSRIQSSLSYVTACLYAKRKVVTYGRWSLNRESNTLEAVGQSLKLTFITEGSFLTKRSHTGGTTVLSKFQTAADLYGVKKREKKRTLHEQHHCMGIKLLNRTLRRTRRCFPAF